MDFLVPNISLLSNL